MNQDSQQEAGLVSIVIPARNEAGHIHTVLDAIGAQQDVGATVEVIVVDDASTDATPSIAANAGARVIAIDAASAGNPARARNIGAHEAKGDPIVFLDADCVPTQRWLASLLNAVRTRATVVGGALDLPPGLGLVARCDYYCGCYFIHSGRPAGYVPHHPPNNLAVRREPFLQSRGFSEQAPLSYTNEERLWLGELVSAGHRIYFSPEAAVQHFNRPGFGNLMRRNYRWGYTALEAKSQSQSTRLAGFFNRPWLVLLSAPLLPFAFTLQIIAAWLPARVIEPLWMSPLIFVSRIAYVAGMVVGGVRWLRSRDADGARNRPSPRWQ
jgi:glycosyltransferase involved in cell wall biosynthesis